MLELRIKDNENYKEKSSELALSIVAEVEMGNVNPLQQLVKIKALSSALDDAKDQIIPLAVEEMAKYGKGETVAFNGYCVSAMTAGGKWDFSNCNHPQYIKLQKKMDDLKKEISEVEKFLKSIKGHVEVADEDTGEMFIVYPATPPASKSTVKIQ
jgi:hypothetical protein